jgi:ATP-dependent helicase HrpB
MLDRKPLRIIPAEKRIEVLCSTIQQNGLKFIGWNEEHQLWQARVMSMRIWRPDESWPDVRNESLLHTVDSWLSPYLIDVHRHSDLLRLNLMEILQGLLPWELQRKLEVLAPPRMQVPSLSLIKIRYMTDGSPPVMEVRLQEVFGLLETPKVNEGRTSVLMHLLSPGFRPVQITMDLHSFWKTTYSDVRKELRVRYPKHHWPEDPWTAQAVRGIKRKAN